MNNLSSYFENIYNSNKLSHSFLIGNINYDEIKDELINVINKYIFNSDIDPENNPDLYIIRPVKGNVAKEEIKKLISEISTTSQFNNNKVYVIENTEKLNDASYNAILKTLEEPKDNIYAFLLTVNMDSVKPTIVSRCQKIFISSELKEEEPSDDIKEIGNELIDYLEKYNVNTFGEYYQVYNKIEDRIMLGEVLKYILGIYFNSLNDYVLKNIKNNITEKNSIETISKKILIIENHINNLNYYLNKNLSIDRLIIEMWRCNNENS